MKRLLFLTFMCLLAMFNSLSAQTTQELIIGDGATYVSNDIPTQEYYNYTISQQIYTAEEMGNVSSSTISSIAFKKAGSSVSISRNLDVYLVNTDKANFTGNKDWFSVAASDLVYSGSVSYPSSGGEWLTIPLTTPFEYTGGNVLLCVNDKSGSYTSTNSFYAYPIGDTIARSLVQYNDGNAYNPVNVGDVFGIQPIFTDAGADHYINSVVKFNMTVSDSGNEGDENEGGDAENPLKSVVAEEIDATQVKVSWSEDYQTMIEDFESGDFLSYNWNNEVSNFPWEITDIAYEGFCAMKSACEGLDNSMSAIEITVDMPADGYMSFYYKISCEGIGDFGRFYIDGEQKLSVIGEIDWTYKQVEITEGVHTLRWEYEKDFMASYGSDAFYIDYINFFIPFTGGWLHYDNGEFVETLGAGEPMPIHWAISYPASDSYAGYSISKLAVYDSNLSGVSGSANATAKVYLGGETAPATLVATKDFVFTGSNDFVEIDLDTPVALDGTLPLWVVMSCDELSFPAAGCAYMHNPNSDWISLDNGASWQHVMTDLNFNYTWMIRAYLDNAKGEAVALPMPKAPKYESTVSTLLAAGNVTPNYVGVPTNVVKSAKEGIASYNVYRKNILNDTPSQLLGNAVDTTYMDNTWAEAEVGVYQWGVSAVYDDNAESSIVWSKPLDKDMTVEVTVSVSTDNGDPTTGTFVTFTNLVEEDVEYTVRLGGETSVTWDEFRKGQYELTVTKSGYTSDTENVTVEIWEDSDFNVNLTEILAEMEDLYVSPTGWAMWNSKGIGLGDEFSYDFEDGMQGWTTIDADGDKNVWEYDNTLGAHSGMGMVLSESFNNDMGVLYPDNYLVSPEKVSISGSSTLTFWACAQDENYPEEHFGVAISTTGNTLATDFTTIAEWTLTAKGSQKGAAKGSKGQGEWYQFTVELGEYSGQQVWIALRHFNCSDEFYLNVDDVELINAGKGEKALLSYQVVLNDDVVADSLFVPYYQHENLTDGTEYVTTVIGNYTNGPSEAVSYTWTKVSESNFAAVSDFTAVYDDDAAQLSWTMPESEIEMLGVMISRNDELITMRPVEGTSFVDTQAAIGDEYCVRVVYGGERDVTYYAMSSSVCAEAIYTIPCDAPEKLFAECAYNEEGELGANVHVSYSAGEWLHYDDGINVEAVGGPESFYWGVMFPADMLDAHNGSFLSKVSMFAVAQSSGDINIYFGGDTAPGILMHTQPYSVADEDAFVEFELTEQLPIDPSMNLWVVFSTTQGGANPAAISAPTDNPNARWVSMDGMMWEDILVGYGMNLTWMVRAFAETMPRSEASEISELTPITDYEYTASTGEFVKTAVTAKGDAFDHYNIYRGTTSDNFELVGESTTKTYFDKLEEGTYYYQVTAVYAEYGEECESEPAAAYGDETVDYVVVEVTSIDENGVNGMMIYPNPAKDNLNIMAEAMNRITITNALGQVMYDQEVTTDNTMINMSQFEAGVYMVRIATETGVAVKRITVVK